MFTIIMTLSHVLSIKDYVDIYLKHSLVIDRKGEAA